MVGGSTRGRPRRKPGPTRGRGRPPRDGRAKPPTLTACFITRCADILDRLKKKDHYNIFLEPVDPTVVAEYDTIVKTPMAITTMANKLHAHQYKSLGEFRRDLDLMWDNCLLFNGTEPNNIFTKKAIELQKVTEKLISAARQELERDKEEINQWKEKHRRNKPANAGQPKPDPAQEALLSTSTEIPRENNGDPNQPNPSASATSVANNRINPRAAYEYAMRQLLRAQYGDNTGLHKRNIEDSTPHHYMTPEGNPVQIGSVRYNPYENRWAQFEDIRRRPDIPTGNDNDAIFNRIPQSSQPNVCSPLEQREFVNVKAYVESLQAYVKDAGEIPSRIIAEFLGPELALRDTMEKRKRRKLDPNSAGGAADINNNNGVGDGTNAGDGGNDDDGKGKNNGNGNSDGDSSSKPKDPLLSACRHTMLNNPPKKIAEFEGEDGLAKFMSAELVEQVKNVPVSVIDFATPYGVCAKSLAEIVQLTRIPGALNIDTSHIRNLEEIHKATADFAARQDPRAVAAMGGASSLTPEQIHEFQLKLTHSIEALTRVMPDRKVIPRKAANNGNNVGNNVNNVNRNMPGINPAAAARGNENANARNGNMNVNVNRANPSGAAYPTRNLQHAANNHPTANGMPNRTAPAPLANVLGPMGNLAPLHGHNQRRPNSIPGMNNPGGQFFKNQAQAASSTSHPMKALPIPNHPNHPNHLNNLNNVNSNRQQQQTQNGINPAMHALMNPTSTPVSQAQRIQQEQQRQIQQQQQQQLQRQQQQQQPALRPLNNTGNVNMQSASSAAARLASMGMMINPVSVQQRTGQEPGKQDNPNMPTLGANNVGVKAGPVLGGILPDNINIPQQQQQQQNVNMNIPHRPNVSNVQRLAHLQMPNALLNNNGNSNTPASAAQPPMTMGRQQQSPPQQQQLQPPPSLLAGNQQPSPLMGNQQAPSSLVAGNQHQQQIAGNQQHPLARNMGSMMGNLGNLPSRNGNLVSQSQSLAVRNSQPQSQAPAINHFPIRPQNIGAFSNSITQQAGMTAARAPVVSAPELSMPMAASAPMAGSAPLLFPNTNTPAAGNAAAVPGGDPLLAPIFGSNDNNTAPAGAANPINNSNVPPGTVPGATNNNTDSPQLDNIFSFDGSALGDGGAAADFEF